MTHPAPSGPAFRPRSIEDALAEIRGGADPMDAALAEIRGQPVPSNAFSDFLGGRSDRGDPETFARNAGESATVGVGDEIVNAIRASASSFGHPGTLIPEYNRLQQETEARSDSLRRENPGSALAGSLAGMAATAGPLSKLLPAVEGGLLKRTAAGAATGAGVGAVAGAGMAGQGRRGEGAVLGGVSGGLLGAAAPAVSDATGAVARRLIGRTQGAAPIAAEAPATDQPVRTAIGTALVPRDPNLPAPVEVGTLPVRARPGAPATGVPFASGSGKPPVPPSGPTGTMRDEPHPRVADFLINKLRQDKQTPRQALDGLLALSPLEGSPERITEISGPNMRGVVRGLEAMPGSAKTTVRSALQASSSRQPAEMVADMERTMGRAVQNTHELVDNLVAARKADAERLYPAARAAGELVQDPATLRAYHDIHEAFPEVAHDAAKRANRILIADGHGDAQVNSVRWFDAWKQGLDNAIEVRQRASDAGQALSGYEAKVLRDKKNLFLRALDKAVPEYGTARSVFGGESEVIEAIQDFEALARNPSSVEAHPNAIRSKMGRLSLAGKQGAQIGIMRGLADRVARTPPTGSVAAKLARTDMDREFIRAAFGDGPQAEAMLSILARRGGIAETNAMIQGSRTAPAAAEMADLMASPVAGAVDVVTKGPKRALIDAVLRTAMKIKVGGGEARMDNLARQLTKQGVDLEDLLRYLADREARTTASNASASRTAATAAGAAAGATGRRP